jgi:hypothetical protein
MESHYTARAQAQSQKGRSLLWVFALGLLWALGVLPAGATVIVDDTFSDGERVTQNAPDSLDWVTSTAGPKTTVTNGMLTLSQTGGAMAYFNPVQLQVGDSLTLSFNYSFTQVSNADNSFMFGLYNSGGSYQTKDAVGFNNNIFTNYTGYATSGVLGTDPSGLGRDHIEVRDQAAQNLLSIGTYTEGATTLQSGAATPGQLYAASMSISRTAAGITVESKIGNTDIVQTYTTEMFTQFDSVGIFSNGDSGTFSIDNVKLDFAGAPEPSTFLAITLFGMVVFSRSLGGRQMFRKWLPRRTAL